MASCRPIRLATASATAQSKPPPLAPSYTDHGGTLASRHTPRTSSPHAGSANPPTTSRAAANIADRRLVISPRSGHKPTTPRSPPTTAHRPMAACGCSCRAQRCRRSVAFCPLGTRADRAPRFRHLPCQSRGNASNAAHKALCRSLLARPPNGDHRPVGATHPLPRLVLLSTRQRKPAWPNPQGRGPSFPVQREDPERAAGRDALQTFVAGEDRVDTADAARHRDVLDAILLPGDRLAFDPRPGLERPQLAARVGVECLELAGELAAEHDIAGRR